MSLQPDEANIVGNMSMQVGVFCGAGIGGVLVSQVGATAVVFMNVVSFLVSAVLTSWIRSSFKREVPKSGTAKPGLVAEFGEALRYLGVHSQIIWLAILQLFVYLTLYICNTLLPSFVDVELGADAAAFGLIDAAWGAGALLGGLALTYIVKKVERRQFGLAALLLLSFAIFVFLTSDTVPQAFAAYLMLGFLTCAIRVNTDTIIVTEVEPRYFGKVKAAITMFISYLGVFVYGLVGYVGDKVSNRTVFLSLCMAVLVGFFLAALPRIGMKRQRAE